METCTLIPERLHTSDAAEAAAEAHSKEPAPLTERQKQRRFGTEVVSKGFQGSVVIDSDAEAAGTYASHEYTDTSRLKDGGGTRMIFWANGCTLGAGHDRISGLGVVGRSKPNPNRWGRRAYHIMRETNAQVAEILAVSMALQIAKDECYKLETTERPSMVVVYSCSKDALLRMRESRFTPSLGGKVVKAGVVAAHFLRELGIDVELRWIPARFKVVGAVESRNAARDGAKYKPPPQKGPDAFIREVQGTSKHAARAKRRKDARGMFCQGAGKTNTFQPLS